MRKVVHVQYVSIDGVVDEPMWTVPFWNDELGALQRQQLFASDALLLGRVTYEGFAEIWPSMTDDDGFADRMNTMPKHVATSDPEALAWNASPLDKDVLGHVARLKDGDGGDLLIYGSQTFADALTRGGLIDEYRLLVHPVAVGRGARIFATAPDATFGLDGVVTTSTGVVVLRYRRP